MLTSSFERMLVIATAVATLSAALGTIISFHIDGATGACIVLVQAAMFVLAILFAPKHGLIWKGRKAEAAARAGGILESIVPKKPRPDLIRRGNRSERSCPIKARAMPADGCRAAPTDVPSAAASRS